MPRIDTNLIDFYENTGGLVTNRTGIRVSPSYCLNGYNFNLFPRGGFSRRNGYSKLNSSALHAANISTGLYSAEFSSGTNVLVGTCGTKLATMDALDGTWDDKTGALTLTAGQNNLWSFAILNDVVVMANGVNTCLQLNSSLTAAVLAGSPAFTVGLFPVEYRGYMFVGNTTESAVAYPDRLRFSGYGDSSSWTAAHYIDIAPKQGGSLRGACVYKTSLLCFKERGIYEIWFQPTRVNSAGDLFPFIENPNPIVPNVGTMSHRSIVVFNTPSSHPVPGQYVFFIDQHGMPRIYAGAGDAMQIGYDISQSRDTTVLSLSDMTKTPAVLKSWFALNYPERSQIWVFGTQTTQMDHCWVLDYRDGWAWSRHKFNDAFTCGALVRLANGTYRVFTGDRTGFFFQHDTTNLDNATAIPMRYRTGFVYLRSPSVKSNWSYMEVSGISASDEDEMNISFSQDGSDVLSPLSTVVLADKQSKWGTMVWGQDRWGKLGVVPKSIEPNFDAKTVSIQFDNVEGSNVIVEGWSLFGKPQGYQEED